MDEGQATPEDYSIIIDEPPKHLGAGGTASGEAAVRAYTRFFEELGRRKGELMPADIGTSEIVLVKTNSDFLRLRRDLKRGHRSIEAAVAREQRYITEGGQDEAHIAKLNKMTESAITNQQDLVIKYQKKAAAKKKTDDGHKVEVSAVFVSFNTAEMRDKVLHELAPKTVAGFLSQDFRNVWPLRKLIGDPPNFEYEDPFHPGTTKHSLLRVQPAREPSDYIWPHMCMKKKKRGMHYLAGSCFSFLFVLGFFCITVFLTVTLVQPFPYRGSFTIGDQLCADPIYIREAPSQDVADKCGLSIAAINHLRNISKDEDTQFGLTPTANWNLYHRELIRLTPCQVSRRRLNYLSRAGKGKGGGGGGAPSPPPRWSVSSDPRVEALLDEHSSPSVSDANHTLFPSCEFLNDTLSGLAPDSEGSPLWQRGENYAGYNYPDPTTGETWRVYCNYGLDQNVVPGEPLRVVSRSYCSDAPEAENSMERDPGPFTNTDGSMVGIHDAISQEECNDVNCVRCLSLFNQCVQSASAEASGNPLLKYRTSALSYVNTLLISLIAQIIYYGQQWFTSYGVARPITHTFAERDFMKSCLLTLLIFVTCVILYVNFGSWGSGAIGVYKSEVSTGLARDGQSLGFATCGWPQVWSLIIMYGTIVMWACFGAMPPMYNWALRILGQLLPKLMTTTQETLNMCYEGYAFLHHYSVSYCIFVVILGTASSTNLPLALPMIAISLFTRWAIDRVYLLYIYQRPSNVDGSLIKLSLRLLPLGLVVKALFMFWIYRDTRYGGTVGIVMLIIACTVLFADRYVQRFFVVNILRKQDKDNSQHKDAANYTNHQLLVQRGLIQSYDPLDELAEDLEVESGRNHVNRGKQHKDHKESLNKGAQQPRRKTNSVIATIGESNAGEASDLQQARRRTLQMRERQSSMKSMKSVLIEDSLTPSGPSPERELSTGSRTNRWPPPLDAQSGSLNSESRQSPPVSGGDDSPGPVSRMSSTRLAHAVSGLSRAGSRARAITRRTQRIDHGAEDFTNTLVKLAEVEERIGTIGEALARALLDDPPDNRLSESSARAMYEMADVESMHSAPATPGTANIAARANSGRAREHVVKQSPFFWRNPKPLPVVAMCPNSGEATHTDAANLWTKHTSNDWGDSWWGRSSRLAGANEVYFFDSWTKTREFIEKSLRVESRNAKGGVCDAGTTGTALKFFAPERSRGSSVGSYRPTLFTYTGLPVSILPPSTKGGKWLLTVSRDRGEFPNLQWKILEADNRQDFHVLLQLHGLTDEVVGEQSVGRRSVDDIEEDIRADRDAVWELQTLAAELCTPANDPAGPGYVYTRWVAVLRAGGVPRKILKVHTNVAKRIDWNIRDPSVDAALQGRLASGYHLVALAGTAPKMNAHLKAYLRKGYEWSEQFVYMAPSWPETWLKRDAPKDMLISCVAYYNNSWTLVFTHATTQAALASAPKLGNEGGWTTPVDQQVLVDEAWPTAKVNELLGIGYTITTVGCGPNAVDTRDVYVVVLSRSPSTIIPRVMCSMGSREASLEHWRTDAKPWHRNWAAMHGVTITASKTMPDEDKSLLPINSRLPKWTYVASGSDLLGYSITNTIDLDIGSFWCSGRLGPASGEFEPATEALVTVTLDLGEPRLVDEVNIFWGDVEPRPIPPKWELVGSLEGSVVDGAVANGEPPIAIVANEAQGPVLSKTPQGHTQGVDWSSIQVSPPRKMRLIELRLRQPQPPSLDYRVAPIGYSIRQIQVIGPGQVIGVEVVPPAPAATIVVGGADDAQVEAVAVHVPRSTLRAPPSSRFVSHAIPTAASEPFVSYASAQPRRRLSGFV